MERPSRLPPNRKSQKRASRNRNGATRQRGSAPPLTASRPRQRFQQHCPQHFPQAAPTATLRRMSLALPHLSRKPVIVEINLTIAPGYDPVSVLNNLVSLNTMHDLFSEVNGLECIPIKGGELHYKKYLPLGITSEKALQELIEETPWQSETICLVSCDHIPRRSWPLFRAKAVIKELIAGMPRRKSRSNINALEQSNA